MSARSHSRARSKAKKRAVAARFKAAKKVQTRKVRKARRAFIEPEVGS